MITIYLIMSAIVFTVYGTSAYVEQEKLTALDWVLILLLSVIWPIIVPMLIIVYLVRKS
ncbi:hypothetical protein AH02_53 [Pseudomonas phage AH02]|nr:hypothetical protein AH02_53 [Pseudomonas phage AH02]